MNAYEDDDLGPSKSQKKRDMDALQKLGEALIALSHERFRDIDIPDSLREAVAAARKITAHGALRRQKQYIGKLMREIDPTPIQAQLDAIKGQSEQHIVWLHLLERWREKLLESDEKLADFLDEYPDTDVQTLRQLIRNARKEHAENRPPKSYRALFQALKQSIAEPDIPGLASPIHDEDEWDD